MIQVKVFKQTTNASIFLEVKDAYQKMYPEVRNLFPQVALLMKLLQTCPASSFECERSFSALRLKKCLGNTMTKTFEFCQRLACASRHTEQDVDYLAREFANRSEIRRKIYGNFCL